MCVYIICICTYTVAPRLSEPGGCKANATPPAVSDAIYKKKKVRTSSNPDSIKTVFFKALMLNSLFTTNT